MHLIPRPFCASSSEGGPAIRHATETDLETLLEIETESFSDHPWPLESFFAYDCLVAEFEGQIAGFLISREIFSGGGELAEREILNLAVAKRFRRVGVATSLLEVELKRGATFFLEVRESNDVARTLYRHFGFTEIGRREDYYQNPSETAIVMRTK